MSKFLTVEFKGWLAIPIEKVTFLNVDTCEEINGLEWDKLSEDDQCDYVLDDLDGLMRDSDNLSHSKPLISSQVSIFKKVTFSIGIANQPLNSTVKNLLISQSLH